MSIATQIQRLQADKADIQDALVTQGIQAQTHGMDDFADDILLISTGTDISDTTATADDVLADEIFYTADGTRTEGTIETVTGEFEFEKVERYFEKDGYKYPLVSSINNTTSIQTQYIYDEDNEIIHEFKIPSGENTFTHSTWDINSSEHWAIVETEVSLLSNTLFVQDDDYIYALNPNGYFKYDYTNGWQEITITEETAVHNNKFVGCINHNNEIHVFSDTQYFKLVINNGTYTLNHIVDLDFTFTSGKIARRDNYIFTIFEKRNSYDVLNNNLEKKEDIGIVASNNGIIINYVDGGFYYIEDNDVYKTDGYETDSNILQLLGNALSGYYKINDYIFLGGINNNIIKFEESNSNKGIVSFVDNIYSYFQPFGAISILPYDFSYGSAVVLNNEIHILGGLDNETAHYKFNGVSWSSVSTLPYHFNNGSAVVYNDEIHILGGSINSYNHYKFDGTSWILVSTLPYYFSGGSAVVCNDEIHILGSNNSGDETKHYKYNGISWEEVSTLPYNFIEGSSVVLNDEIYIIGGENSDWRNCFYKYDGTNWEYITYIRGGVLGGSSAGIINILGNDVIYYIIYNDMYIYIPGEYDFEILSIPYKFTHGSSVVLNNQINIMGTNESIGKKYHFRYNNGDWYYKPDYVKDLPADNVFSTFLNNELNLISYEATSPKHYKLVNGIWYKLTKPPIYINRIGNCVLHNNEIHVFGGGWGNSHYKYNGISWEEVSTTPYPITYCTAISFNNEIHILGGDEDDNTATNHYKFNGIFWEEVSVLPCKLSEGGVVVLNNEIHILGGYEDDINNKIKHYKFDGISWTKVSTLPYNFHSSSAVVLNNDIHILGGFDNKTSHYKFDGVSWSSVSTLPYEFYDSSVLIYNNILYLMGGTVLSYQTPIEYLSTIYSNPYSSISQETTGITEISYLDTAYYKDAYKSREDISENVEIEPSNQEIIIDSNTDGAKVLPALSPKRFDTIYYTERNDQRIADLVNDEALIASIKGGESFTIPLLNPMDSNNTYKNITISVSNTGLVTACSELGTNITIQSATAVIATYGFDIHMIKYLNANSVLLVYSWYNSKTTALVRKASYYFMVLTVNPDGTMFNTAATAFAGAAVLPYGTTAGSYYDRLNIFPVESNTTGLYGHFGYTYINYGITSANVANAKRIYYGQFLIYPSNTNPITFRSSFVTAVGSCVPSTGADCMITDTKEKGFGFKNVTSAGVETVSQYYIRINASQTKAWATYIIYSSNMNQDFPDVSYLGTLNSGYHVVCHGRSDSREIGICNVIELNANNTANRGLITLAKLNLPNDMPYANCNNYDLLRGNILLCRTNGKAYQIFEDNGVYSLYYIGTFNINEEYSIPRNNKKYIAKPLGIYSNLFYQIGETVK